MATSVSASLLLLLFVSVTCAYNQLVQEGITEAVSSSTYSKHYKALFAVDGDFSQNIDKCSHTAIERGIKEAWLRIDLRDIYSIKSVKFWYRGDMVVRLHGYPIRVSNSSELPPPENSCYRDPGNVVLPTVIENGCESTARYVWFYQDNEDGSRSFLASILRPNPIIEICEVQVFACPPGSFGRDCINKCSGNCLHHATCDKETGICKACSEGWTNDFYQIRLTTVISSSTYGTNKPSLASDGDFNQNIQRCSHTDDKPDIKEAWLLLDLGNLYSMKSVKFWYRNDRKNTSWNTIRLRGYSIRVSNDTNLPPPESSCYTDPGNVTLPTVIEKDCERTARYVWIYQGNTLDGDCPILEICEVQVFGCKTGRYGDDCSNTCDHCKNNASCDITSGVCDNYGCADQKLAPPSCSQCLTGFGDNCRRRCSPFCKENKCDIKMGTCLLGCKDGYLGKYCNTTCRYGNYGDRCQKSCNHCLQNTTCHHVNGFCLSGCKEGYKGEKCDTACSVGEYGENCANHCGHCFNNEPCNRIDGRCNDCETGYHGFKCDKECSNKTYGLNCLGICGACLDSSPCHHVDGRCPSGCNPGWQTTPKCDAPCPPGTFGPNCINQCSGNCLHHAPCDKESGKCKSCSEGWTNDFCNEKSGEPITDLEKLTLQHLKLDNERLVMESEMLKKESQKISSETAFLKIKEKYLRLKMQSEFQIVMNITPETQLSEKKAGQSFGSDGQNVTQSP